jgi:zinc transport system substrate-binding protein
MLQVAAGLYPLQYIAERVGEGRVVARNLTPPGVEPHDAELSPDQAEAIEAADLVLTIGGGFQPSLEKAAGRRKSGVITAVSAGVDPHVWLDPQKFADLVRQTAKALAAADPTSAALFADQADTLLIELEVLDSEIASGLANCMRRTVVSSHDAFSRFSSRYNLQTEGIAGLSPRAEPTADRLDELVRLIKKTQATTVFTEDQVSPALAETLAREAGVSMAVLSPIEFAPEQGDYFTAMRSNLRTLREALDCG